MRIPPTPVLMYHKVGAPVREKPDRSLNVPTDDFGRQMRVLSRLGYTGVTFETVVRALAHGCPLPRKPVCVTFDDGYRCVRDNAAPILAELGWPATVFVPSALVGRSNEWDIVTGKPVVPIMGWDELRGLADAGWEMAGHTRTHPHLDRLGDGTALQEIQAGRQDLAERLGTNPTTFCYPFGGMNDGTRALVRQAGFEGACTTRSGLARLGLDPFLLPRVKIAYRDGVLGLLYRLLIRPRLP